MGAMHTEPLPPPTPVDLPAGPTAASRPPGGAPPPAGHAHDEPTARRFPKLSAAGWLAATGATLLLIASIVVVASQWQTITPEIRFSGLVAALLAVYFVAEAGRERYPSTSSALATLAATMTAPVGIAAASSINQTWPMCVLVGGVAALVAAEVQSRRWDVSILKAATVAGVGLAAAGLAAIIDAPVGLIVAGAAAVALATGAWRRSVVLSVAVGCSPALLALSDAGIGTGTLARIGATGSVLAWSAPLSAAVAAIVIGISAHRRAEIALVALSVATLAGGVLVGLGHRGVADVMWWSIPAFVVIAVEAAAVTGRRSVWGAAATAVAPWVVAPVAIGGLFAPLLAVGGRAAAEFGNGSVDHVWAVPLGVTAAALAVASAGSSRRSARALAVTFAASAGATLAAVMMTGATVFGWPEVVTLATIAAATALVGRTQGAAWFHAAAGLAVLVVAAALGTAGLEVDQAAMVLMALAVTLTGLAFLRGDIGPLDTAALSTAGVLVLLSRGTEPIVDSLIGLTVSGQLLLYAIAQRRPRRVVLAASSFGISLVSLWWTTGTNEVFLAQVERYGADGADVALGIATLVLLAAGAVLRRVQPASSWLAYSPGLGMATAWLLDAQFEAQGAWATVGALGIGVVATAVGGSRRLGAPLVIGTGMIAGTVVISAGPRLAAAPTWAWIAAGGIGLLVLAAAIERSSRPLIGAARDGDEISIVEQFRRDFD